MKKPKLNFVVATPGFETDEQLMSKIKNGTPIFPNQFRPGMIISRCKGKIVVLLVEELEYEQGWDVTPGRASCWWHCYGIRHGKPLSLKMRRFKANWASRLLHFEKENQG